MRCHWTEPEAAACAIAEAVHACWLLLALVGQLEVTPEQHVDRARACLNSLDFECAERAFQAVEPRLSALTPALAVEARILGAEAALSLERWTLAEARLLAVLVAQPRFAPPAEAWPPRWREVLEAARQRVPDRSPPRIAADLPAEALLGAPLLVRAGIHDPSGVDRPTLRVGDRALVMTSTDGRTFQAVVPAEQVVEPAVTLWIEAHDAFGNGPARSEARTIPVSPRVAADEGSAWWLWALAGGAVIAGGITAAALLSAPEPGAVRLDIVWPTR